MALVLGIDSSTQSTKVEVRDADDGRLVASGRAPHPATTPPRSEQDPEAWWQALQTALAQCGRPRVAAIAVAGQQHGLVVLGEDGRVLRPAKLWNDTESAEDAARLVERVGAESWARQCGSMPVAAFTISKLAWLKRHEPDVFSRVRRILLPHDWLTYRLTGNFTTDRGDASGTGYFSPEGSTWRADLLSLVDETVEWMDKLPTVLRPDEPAGTLSATASEQLQLPAGIAVAPGTGDNMAAALGLGVDRAELVISIGTSGTAYTISDSQTADASGAVAGFADATGRFLPLVCTLNGTKVTDAFARVLGVSREAFDALALATSGAGGLVLLPYLDGERTPNRPHARGVVAGIGSDVTRESVARAAIEGVSCGLLDGVDALVEAGVAVDRTRARLIGGGARSPAFQRIFASLLGAPVAVMPDVEHVARGACVQAAAVLRRVNPRVVAKEWRPSDALLVEPELTDEVKETRARFAAVRDA